MVASCAFPCFGAVTGSQCEKLTLIFYNKFHKERGLCPLFCMAKIEIYGLLCPNTGEVRYIGKAKCAQKRFKQHLSEKRRKTPLYSWIKSLFGLGKVPELTILENCTEEEWRDAEIRLIELHKGSGKLLNLAKGGDEPFCDISVRRANGFNVVKKLHSDPQAKRIWKLKSFVGRELKLGNLPESFKVKLRQAAQKAPDIFGQWANV
jgi:hypothetical protein